MTFEDLKKRIVHAHRDEELFDEVSVFIKDKKGEFTFRFCEKFDNLSQRMKDFDIVGWKVIPVTTKSDELEIYFKRSDNEGINVLKEVELPPAVVDNMIGDVDTLIGASKSLASGVLDSDKAPELGYQLGKVCDALELSQIKNLAMSHNGKIFLRVEEYE